MDCSTPGSSVHGIFQARVLEWGAIAFSSLNLLDLKPLKFEALLEAYLSFLSCPSPKCILKHLSISTATTFSCLCDCKSQKPGLPVLFFIHFNSLSTKRLETSFYSINQITWTPDYTSLWLPNTVSTKHKLCVPQSPPCSEPACLFKSHHSSPWPCTQPEVHSLRFWAHSFHSSVHFHWLFPLSGTLFLQIYMGQLFPITQGSPLMSLPQRSYLGTLASRRKDPSCPTIFT